MSSDRLRAFAADYGARRLIRRLLGDYFQHSIEEYLELLEAGKKAGIPQKRVEADYVPGKERNRGVA